MKHVLYTPNDFKDNEQESKIAEMVIDAGLSICKVCGEFEAGLDKPCRYKETVLFIREKLDSGGVGTRSQISEAVNKVLDINEKKQIRHYNSN